MTPTVRPPNMPLAPVNPDGAELYYEDTGAPQGSDVYKTLILLHGAVFHSAVFRPMLQFAAQHNLRLVALTLRDYPGSTPYTSEEIAALKGDKDSQTNMIKDRGNELAAFLAWFIQKERIPPLSTSFDQDEAAKRADGGLAVLGWSWGNCIMLSLLAHAGELPASQQDTLGKYLRTCIIFDVPLFPWGVPLPTEDGPWNPMSNPNIPPERANEIFLPWVTGYFAHSESALASFEALSSEDILAGLALTSIPDPAPEWQSTQQRMSAEQYAEITDPSVMERSHHLMQNIHHEVYKENTRHALRDAIALPHVRAVLVWCDMSVGETVYAAWHLAHDVANAWSPDGRKVEFKRFRGANHFPHWDQPERTLSLLSEIL
ncbi:alpha/beta-hydrolase [Laetiporus sulphureus 93-53]|uniref:Alpha/beta-hydrolase n=1 Tax=Laetiporus sulphureus 93-53 TaxID=1314785 RepID=A0A165DIZ5_9APHY|nr:alpha/beta-hydrolase [Laetiporus sulphureus 93-53]KZT04987.1 alpha/beta-hydrolase [Laetiporus sulphureus 93-53]